jgi:hypothetical protein
MGGLQFLSHIDEATNSSPNSSHGELEAFRVPGGYKSSLGGVSKGEGGWSSLGSVHGGMEVGAPSVAAMVGWRLSELLPRRRLEAGSRFLHRLRRQRVPSL